MCDAKFRIGYNPCVRERAIDMLMDGNSKAHVARTVGVTYPTVIAWLTSYRLAGAEIDQHLSKRIELATHDTQHFNAQLCRPYS